MELIAPDLVELAEELGRRLRAREATLATAESLTAGAIAAAITAAAGASAYLAGAVVTYQTDEKVRQLGLDPRMIERCGVVSKEVACAMARAVAERFTTSCSIAVTGVAGPGDSVDAPAGTVWIATAVDDDVRALCYSFGRVGRDRVRFATVKAGLRQLCEHLGDQDTEFLRTT